jgi:hypothetical protein
MKIRHITWRTKLICVLILMIAGITLLFASVLLPTIDIISKNRTIRGKLSTVEESRTGANKLVPKKNTSTNVDSLTTEMQAQQLFDALSHATDSLNIVLEDFSLLEKQDRYPWVVLTNKYTVSGNFKNLVQLLSYFENAGLDTQLSSVKCYISGEGRTEKKLHCDIFAKSIVRKNTIQGDEE